LKIYTKYGDDGTTCVPYIGSAVPKSDASVIAIGDVDELNSYIGIVLKSADANDQKKLQNIQRTLFEIGAQMSIAMPRIKEESIEELEVFIDAIEEHLPKLEDFILPDSLWHVARAVCRRAERSVVALRNESKKEVFDLPIEYLNRLSDLLFVLARHYSDRDVRWH